LRPKKTRLGGFFYGLSTAVEKPLLVPDAGPLITLAYADALDLLRLPGWPIVLVDMVLHELTRAQTPTSARIADWVERHGLALQPTQIGTQYAQASATTQGALRKANLGERAIQEFMNQLALREASQSAVFLFEDHKIARTGFLLPPACQKVSTRAFLSFLENKGLIASGADVERAAVQTGRAFSQIRFSP
jgi:hypothetical protein